LGCTRHLSRDKTTTGGWSSLAPIRATSKAGEGLPSVAMPCPWRLMWREDPVSLSLGRLGRALPIRLRSLAFETTKGCQDRWSSTSAFCDGSLTLSTPRPLALARLRVHGRVDLVLGDDTVLPVAWLALNGPHEPPRRPLTVSISRRGSPVGSGAPVSSGKF